MAAALTVLLLAAAVAMVATSKATESVATVNATEAVATIENAKPSSLDGQGCVSKGWGRTTGQPISIAPTILASNIFDYDLTISNPCPLGKVGIVVAVCDMDATPAITIYSADHSVLMDVTSDDDEAIYCRDQLIKALGKLSLGHA